MQNQDLVSIITPAYNAERFLSSTIQSVINQTYLDWELLIVIDHNSKDTSKQIALDYSNKDSRIRCITSPLALGAAANRNIALEQSRGYYIAFIDADDLWTQDKLEKQIHFMRSNNINFSFTSFRRISEDGHKVGQAHQVPDQVNYSSLLQNNTIACLTAVFEKESFGDIRFQEHGWEDMSFWLQILKRTEYAYGLNLCLAEYRIVKGSRSNNKLFAAKLRWNTYRLVENLPLSKSLYLFGVYILTSLLKYRQF